MHDITAMCSMLIIFLSFAQLSLIAKKLSALLIIILLKTVHSFFNDFTSFKCHESATNTFFLFFSGKPEVAKRKWQSGSGKPEVSTSRRNRK